MKAHSKLNTIVVGAGGGGIASALLASLRGESVTLVEAHSYLGGCASYFRRGKFVFDAGATTVSGVGTGEPLGELFGLLGKTPDLVLSDPGIVFHLSSGKVIRYHHDFERWMQELEKHFPQLSHRAFWALVKKINQKSWKLLRDVSTFPMQSLNDFLPVFKHPEHVSLVPHLLVSTELMLKRHGLDTPDYLELVNGILIISAQGTSAEIPFLVGAMALSYPGETYAPRGGMKGLMDFFEAELVKRDIAIRKNSPVISFRKNEITLSTKEVLHADRLVMNLPIWNLASLAEGKLKEQFSEESEKRPEAWGAFTLYFGVKGAHQELYHQVHLNHPLVKNYFVSFSIPGDLNRAPEGHQAVSISTHVYVSDAIERARLTEIIMADFVRRFGGEDIKFLNSGTPATFEKFTGRYKGFVGGLPFLYGKNPFSLLSPLTKEASVFRVGDTVFPGQGICGVVAGALQLHKRLS